MADLNVSVPNSVSHTGIPIFADTHALARLARDLRLAAPAAWAATRVGLKAAAEIVAEDARVRTAYSSRIEWTIKTRVGGAGSVKVVAGGEGAPNAAPIENGGRGFVRHPTFSPRPGVAQREGWTNKNSRPAFLAPALDAHREEVLKMIEDSVYHGVCLALGAK